MGLGAVKTILLYKDAIIPKRQSDYAVGFDVCAHNVKSESVKNKFLEKPFRIKPGKTVIFGTGLTMEIPVGYKIEVCPRSGLARKNIGITNSPGTIDPDYRGEIGVMLCNRGDKSFSIEKGMRIAQLMFVKVETPSFTIIEDFSQLTKTTRNTGGFGSTGLFDEGFGTSEYEYEKKKRDRYFMEIVVSVSRLSTCIRGCKRDSNGVFPRDTNGYFTGQARRFGCVIAKELKIISSGFNCQYPGARVCSEVGCLRDKLGIRSGEEIEKCQALHAEQMAIIAAIGSGESMEGSTIYVNAEPCLICAKLIAGLKKQGLEELVILKGQYPNNGLAIIRGADIAVREIVL